MIVTPMAINAAIDYVAPLMANAPYIKFGIQASFITASLVSGSSDTTGKNAYEMLDILVKDNSDALSVGTLTYVAAGAFGAATLPALYIATGAAFITDYAWTAYDKGTVTMPSSVEYITDKAIDALGMVNQIFAGEVEFVAASDVIDITTHAYTKSLEYITEKAIDAIGVVNEIFAGEVVA
jgi:hypothetical protein